MKTQAFIPVFKVRIKKLRKSITEELEKTKSERRKGALKGWIQDLRRLQATVTMADTQNKCPHCGERL
jgi:hypothetical protein